MLQPDAFPDWGPEVKDVSGQPRPVAASAAARDVAHDVDQLGGRRAHPDRAVLIWFETGALDMIKEVDESLHMILEEVMEERLEEEGIER